MSGRGRKRGAKQQKKGAPAPKKRYVPPRRGARKKSVEEKKQENNTQAKNSGAVQQKNSAAVQAMQQRNSAAHVQHKCVLCNLILSSKEALKEHFRDHANNSVKRKPETSQVDKAEPTNVSCDDCEQKFATLREAIMHKHKQHPRSNTRFYCQHCGKHFPLKICKDMHVESEHPNQKPVPTQVCPDCGATFYSKGALGFHTKTLHSGVVRLISPVVTFPPSKKVIVTNSGTIHSAYYCHLCGSEYVIKYNLQRHLQNGHSAIERQNPPEHLCRCTACEAIFYNRKAFETHNLTHTPDDIYVKSEEIRAKIVSKVDQDYNPQRVLPQKPFPHMIPTRAGTILQARLPPPAFRMAARFTRPLTVGIRSPVMVPQTSKIVEQKKETATNNKDKDDDDVEIIEEKDDVQVIDEKVGAEIIEVKKSAEKQENTKDEKQAESKKSEDAEADCKDEEPETRRRTRRSNVKTQNRPTRKRRTRRSKRQTLQESSSEDSSY